MDFISSLIFLIFAIHIVIKHYNDKENFEREMDIKRAAFLKEFPEFKDKT